VRRLVDTVWVSWKNVGTWLTMEQSCVTSCAKSFTTGGKLGQAAKLEKVCHKLRLVVTSEESRFNESDELINNVTNCDKLK